MYMKNGIKLHPRQTKQFFSQDSKDKRLTCRPTFEQQQEAGIQHYKGKQFKYLFFTCNKREKKRLMKECNEMLSRKYPKEDDLEWKIQVVFKEVHWYLMTADNYHSKPQREEFFVDSGYYKFHEIYHLLRFSNEKQIVERAYQEYLEMRSNGLWGKQHKYY